MEEVTKAAEVTTGQPQSAKEASLQGCLLSHISEIFESGDPSDPSDSGDSVW